MSIVYAILYCVIYCLHTVDPAAAPDSPFPNTFPRPLVPDVIGVMEVEFVAQSAGQLLLFSLTLHTPSPQLCIH